MQPRPMTPTSGAVLPSVVVRMIVASAVRCARQGAAGEQEHRLGDPEAARGKAADQYRHARRYGEFETEQRFLPAGANPGRINGVRTGATRATRVTVVSGRPAAGSPRPRRGSR